MSSRLWDKGQPTDELVLRFTVGQDYRLDERLVPFDVQASQAHARMLASVGHLEAGEAERLCDELDRIGAAHAAGEWHISLEEEDCHTALEARLTEALGDLGGKIHLGRSRNDQVLVALRLYYKSVIEVLVAKTEDAASSLQPQVESGIALPGYTHMQRAMPSSVGEWAGAFQSELRASAVVLRNALALVDKNPLGSAAGYGTPGLHLDRDYTTKALGFTETQEPVTAAQLSRGKAEAALAFGLCMVLQDLGRLAGDLCLFNTAEFGFVELPAAFTTGSSIMPQKRNPDVYELVRGHSAQAPADLQAIMAITAKMTSGYHRDLQLIKEPLFRLIDRSFDCLEVMTRAIANTQFVEERCEAAMSSELYAAQRAFELVQNEKISFREAYRRVAKEIGN